MTRLGTSLTHLCSERLGDAGRPVDEDDSGLNGVDRMTLWIPVLRKLFGMFDLDVARVVNSPLGPGGSAT